MSAPHLASAFATIEDGRVRLHGAAAALWRWFDARFLEMAMSAGAVECRFPATISREALARAGFLDAFPGGATALASEPGRHNYLLCPAVCYHAYDWFAGQSLAAPVVLTAAQTCFREADRAAPSPSRLWEFTMREVIFLGPAEWVSEQCDDWARRTQAFAASLGLEAAIEPATDPFFGGEARGRRLLQQVKNLKRELRVACDGQRIAAASINRHEAFFSTRFGFDMGPAGAAHSGCAAFGLERWALALLERHGDRAATMVEAAKER